MLLVNQIQDFFSQHNLQLNNKKVLSQFELYHLYNKAEQLSYSFVRFMHAALVSIGQERGEEHFINVHFTSWDDLFDAYAVFTTGLTGLKC